MVEKNLLVLFGGRSTEHEVSCVSALNIMKTVDRNEYTVLPVGITKEGKWLFVRDENDIANGTWKEKGKPCLLSPDASVKALLLLEEGAYSEIPVDVIFPALHGLNGEDGTVQGLFELACIPYVGCGVLASAASMDKAYTKIIAHAAGIRQADYVLANRDGITGEIEEVVAAVEAKFTYPVFVKPSCAGSSVGVSKARNREELKRGLLEAAKNDFKVLVEEAIVGRELECAVFDNGDGPLASGVGEILPAAEFYDYDAKYNNDDSETLTDPELPEGAEEKIRETAKKVFTALGCHSLSRVDFFLTDAGEVVLNEINTLPGFTAISMYPKLFAARGIDGETLTKMLIGSAYTRKDH